MGRQHISDAMTQTHKTVSYQKALNAAKLVSTSINTNNPCFNVFNNLSVTDRTTNDFEWMWIVVDLVFLIIMTYTTLRIS